MKKLTESRIKRELETELRILGKYMNAFDRGNIPVGRDLGQELLDQVRDGCGNVEEQGSLYDVKSVGDWDDAGDGPAFYRDVIDSDQWGSLVDYAAMSSHNTHAEIERLLMAAVLGVLRRIE